MRHSFTGGGRTWTIDAPLYFETTVPATQDAVVPFCGAACSLDWHEDHRHSNWNGVLSFGA